MSKRTATSDLNQDNWQDEDSVPEEAGTWNKASAAELAGRAIKKAVRRSIASPNQSSDKPSVFKNFSGFATGDSSASKGPMFSFDKSSNFSSPKFNFGSTSTDASKKLDSTSVVKSPSSTSDLFTFKPSSGNPSPLKQGTSSTSSFGAAFSTLPMKNTDSQQNTNGLDLEKSNKTNGSAAEKNEPSTKDSSESYDNYLANLKALNVGVKDWINQHVDKNPHLNLEPVFIDYRKHFQELQKTYQSAKDSKTSQSAGNEKKDSTSTKSGKQSSPIQNMFKSSVSSPPSEKSSLFSFGADKPNQTSTSASPVKFSFGQDSSKDTGKSSFSFGNSLTSASSVSTSMFGGSSTTTTTGFTFGAGSSTSNKSTFSFGSTLGAKDTSSEARKEETSTTSEQEPSDEPPKVEVEVKEDDSFYEMKCKLFYKKESSYVDKGVGMLFLKKVEEKTQLIIRNVTKIGTILLNIVLSSSLPIQRLGKKDVLIVCVPNPPIDSSSNAPVSMLIRVKTTEDADNLLKKLKESQK